jgi:DNA-binding CsgD family transcriptional regulator
MKISETKASGLLGTLYEAAVQPELLPIFVRDFCREAGGEQAWLLRHDFKRNTVGIDALHNVDDTALDLYGRHYFSVDEWFKHGFKRFRTGLCSEGQLLCSDDILLRSEFYNDYLRQHSMFYKFFGNVVRNDTTMITLSIVRDFDQGSFAKPEVDMMEFFMPHLQRAMQLKARMCEIMLLNSQMELALDQLSQGAMFVNAQGYVRLMNKAAARIMTARDGLLLDRGHLFAAKASESAQLRNLLRQSILTMTKKGIWAGGNLLISRRSRSPLHVMVSPFSPPESLRQAQPVVIVFVNDPERHVLPRPNLLQRAYRLTPAEANQAVLLAEGKSLKEVAEAQHVSLHTVRHHLNRIFAKTGTRRQSDLVRLLLSCAPQLFCD